MAAADSKVLSEPQRFKGNALDLYDHNIAIVKWVEEQGTKTDINLLLFNLGRMMVNGWDPEYMITEFIKKTYTYWPSIKAKDEKFLINNAAVLFGDLPKENVEGFTRLYSLKRQNSTTKTETYLVPQPSRDTVWDLLSAMVRNSIRFIHQKRRPEIITVEEVKPDGSRVVKQTSKYRVEFFPDISVRRMIEVWNVEL